MATLSADELFEEGMKLDEPERLRLAQELQLGKKLSEASFIDDEMDDAWLADMRARLERERRGEGKSYTIDQAREIVRQHLQKKS